jgi:hypothetical protein
MRVRYGGMRWFVLAGVLVCLGVSAAFFMPRYVRYLPEIFACDLRGGGDQIKIDCWQRLMERVMEEKGTAEAIVLYQSIVELHPKLFERAACDPAVHFLGDVAFFVYLQPLKISIRSLCRTLLLRVRKDSITD